MAISALSPVRPMPLGTESGTYRIVAASLPGASHIRSGRGSDDALAFYQDGEFLVAVVADGAGSAPKSAIGAKWISAAVTHRMRRLVRGSPLFPAEAPPEEDAARSLVEEIVREARMEIIERARSEGGSGELTDNQILKSYHSTVSGVVMQGSRGFLFQIGDGLSAACGGDCWPFDEEWYETPHRLLPENGEYANQTWFYTMADWAEHLRICPFEGAEAILLMTDGVTPFLLGRDGRFDWWFLGPLLRHIRDTSAQPSAEALSTILSRAEAELIDDDKTMLVILRPAGG